MSSLNESPDSDVAIVSLTDLCLGALALGVLVLMAFVLAQKPGLTPAQNATRFHQISLKKLAPNTSLPSGSGIGIAALVKGEWLEPGGKHKQVNISPLKRSAGIQLGSNSASDWLLELRGEFTSADGLLVYLVSSGPDSAFNPKVAKLTVGMTGSKQEVNLDQLKFYSTLMKLTEHELGVSASLTDPQNALNSFSISNTKIKAIKDKNPEKVNVGNLKEFPFASEQATAVFQAISKLNIPGLERPSRKQFIYHRVSSHNFDVRLDAGWQARFVLEADTLGTDKNFDQAMKGFNDDNGWGLVLKTLENQGLSKLYIARTKRNVGIAMDRWHCYLDSDSNGHLGLFVQAIEPLSGLSGRCFAVLDSKLVEVYLSPDLRQILTPTDEALSANAANAFEEIKAGLKLALRTKNGPHWVCACKNDVAWIDGTQISGSEPLRFSLFDGDNEQLTSDQLRVPPSFFLQVRVENSVGATRRAKSTADPAVSVEAKDLKAKITTFAYLLRLNDEALVGLRQDPLLWRAAN